MAQERDGAGDTIAICPICRSTVDNVRASVTNCGHLFCERCIAEHVWRQQFAAPIARGKTVPVARQACPVCRSALTAVHPTTQAVATTGSSATAKYRAQLDHRALAIGRVKFTMCIPDVAHAEERLERLFGTKTTNMKLILRGRQVSVAQWMEAGRASPHELVATVLAVRLPRHTAWTFLQHAYARMLQQLTAWTYHASDMLHAWMCMLGRQQPVVLLNAFLTSASPTYQAPAQPHTCAQVHMPQAHAQVQ